MTLHNKAYVDVDNTLIIVEVSRHSAISGEALAIEIKIEDSDSSAQEHALKCLFEKSNTTHCKAELNSTVPSWSQITLRIPNLAHSSKNDIHQRMIFLLKMSSS